MKEIITLATSESIIYVTIEKNLECPDMSNGGWGSFHPPLKLSNFDLRCLITKPHRTKQWHNKQ